MKSDVALAGLTLAQRSELLRMARARDLARRGSALPPIEPAAREGRVPLSFAQQRLWFVEQLGDLGSTYHIARRLRLRGELDRAALVRALDRIVARHEALRTTFAQVDGVPEQRIAPADVGFHLVEHDLTGRAGADAELERLMAEEVGAPFDLEQGPLIRGRLIRLAAEEHVLLVTMHHIVSDAWSMEVLTRELGALYGAFRRGEPDPLPALPVQYADYAAWQRRWIEGEVLREQTDYWTRMLAGAPELLDVPTDHARPARMDHGGAAVELVLDEELTAGLKALGRRHGTTLYMTLLAGWAVVLSRLSGQEDVVVGTPTAGRGRREIEGLIGFFVNTLALRLDLSGAPTVGELLGRVKKRALEAQHHQDIPFEQVVERVDPVRSLAHHPLFQALFAWQSASEGGRLSLPGLDVSGVGAASSQVTLNLDLSLSLREVGDRVVGGVRYSTALFEPATAERYAGYLRRVLEEMVADEGRPVERLALMPENERVRVLQEWNRTEAEYPRESCVHELFQAWAARTPDAAAVVFEGAELTYAELNARANRLAHELRARGVGPDARVAICTERGPESMVGLLAVLKAGGAYVPLDPEYPAERLAYMLADSAPAVVLTQARLRDRVATAAAPVLALDAASPAWADRPATDPARGALTPEHLAYVIYTSGSTGMPKGVGVPHRALASQLAWAQRTWALGPHEAVLQRISLSFDVSVRELFWPLAVGARVVLAPAGHGDPDVLVETIAREGIGAVHMVPSLLQPFLEHPRLGECAHLARVICGGEVLSPALARRFHERLPNAALYHMYGPTETTVGITAARCEAGAPDGRLPLGRPVANTRVYVLDGRGEPVPVGAAGELYVGGAQVARGYLDRPEQTAERFVADPFSGQPGARLYRTGDRVRWLPGGELEFLGRVDHQVKVRGFRIELGEIEARLAEHPGVREAVVLVREDAPGDARLVAYVAAGPAAGADALRAHLAATLPEYMVPAAYVRLDALPLTPNGKVDRNALPAPEGDAYASREYEPPAGDTEQALAEIWAEVLGVERVGRGDDFFGLGGHSLLAVQVVSRVRQVLEVEVELREMFTRPVLRDFARELETAARAELPAIEPAPREGRIPLSFGQQRLWFLEQLGNLGSTYHVSKRQRLRGELARAALVRALDALVARHEALRTTFAQVDGVPEQRIAPADAGFHLVEHDLAGQADARTELQALVAEEAGAPFDLERGPLIRGRLIRLAPDDHLLLITMHHIVSDGWSMGVLTRELGALYDAFRRGAASPLPPLPVQYADYAAWQRRWVEGRVLQEQADYWTRTLAGAPELLELPTDRPRPAHVDRAGARVGVELDEALTAGLKALSRRHGTTLYMTLLAGWATVLSRLSGQDDVVVGSPMAGRGRREIEGLIGFFVNTLALRLDLSGAPTAAELLRRVKERVLEAQHHQDIPFEQVVDLVAPVRTLAHHPLFQVTFAWQNTPRGAREGLSLPGLQPDRIGVAASDVNASVDLWLGLWESGGRIVGAVTYSTALYERETVERHVGYLRRVLREMVADDGRPVERLPLLPDAERARVVETWNGTAADYPAASCIHELFQAHVQRAPDAAAVFFENRRLSYAELNARANRLAHDLRSRGVGPEVRVALCVERGPEMVAAVLAVLKAGGAYVPLDPAYPRDRLAHMLADSAPAVVLTQSAVAEALAGVLEGLGGGVPVLELDAAAPAWTDQPETDPARGGLSPEHPAYVIYTSGSTGRPKGVLVPHRGLCNVAVAQQRAFGVGPDDRVLQFASLSFDAAAFELVMALASGAALCLAPREELLPGPGLLGVLRRDAVTTVTLPPSALAALPVEELPALRTITVAGEALPAELVARWGVRHRLWNLYGPTEATIWSTAAECGDPARKPDIGAPIANVRAYVLDAALEPLPVGVAGELYVGGAGVARGYLGRPALTAERFVPDPFTAKPGARLYRTGDRVRWLTDGRLDFIGRIDHQVKLRGYRIELGEIESRLMEHPAVREAVVIAREDTPGDARLVAYVVGDETAGADVLRAYLGETLPEYMVPAAYLRMDALPVTPNGKLDRKALPAPEGDAYARHAYEAPVGETEELLAQLWSEVLGVERVSRHDNFFELGGHSLLAMQVIAYMREMDLHVEVQALFEAPTPAELARLLAPPVTEAPSDGGPEARGRGDRAIPVRPSGSRPPLFLVHEGAGSTAYAQVLHPHIDPEIPVYALPAPSLSGAPLRTVEGMAARLVRMIREVQPTGPYRVAGWSFGGVLAYEIALQLIGEDEGVEFVGMIDSYHPGHPRLAPRDAADENGALLHVARMAQDPDAGARMQADVEAAAPGEAELEAFVARCRAKGRIPAHVTVAQFREMRDHRRAHERALREYRPQPIPVAVHQFPAAESPEPDPSRGWAAVLPAPLLQVIPVPGTHLSMMSAPHTEALGAALCRRLDAPRAGGGPGARDVSPLMKLRGGKPGVAPLFCVPGAGTSVTSFIELAGCVIPSWPVHGLQPRGMDGRTVPHTTVAAAAEHYLRAVHEACPEGPIHLLGHSFGGWVAFEMALRLREAGRPVASLTILDSEVPDQDEGSIREYDGVEAFLKLVDTLELTAERSLGITSGDARARDEAGRLKLLHGKLLQHGLMTARSTHEALYGPLRTFARCLRTTYCPSGVYPDPLRLVLVDDPRKDADANRAQFAKTVRGWRRWAPDLVFSAGAGNHVTALKPPHVATLASLLAEEPEAGVGTVPALASTA